MLDDGVDDVFDCSSGGGNDDDYDDARKEYILREYLRNTPAVRWHKIRSGGSISPREGHMACTFPADRNEEERVVVTGGFSDDSGVYVLQTRGGVLGQWTRLLPRGHRDFIYGATLTVLDSTRAIRFGGFQSGGYSDECNILMLLTLEERDSGSLTCRWEIIQDQNSHLAAPRAYHTATLLAGRYLLVIGGMTERGSIMSLSMLDTFDWTWLGCIVNGGPPSGRHGHSVVLDERRDRLVLFGGGSGSDLLRTGEDNSEVWELRMGDGWITNLKGSFPWTWRKLHRDIDDDDEEEDGAHGSADRANEGFESNATRNKLTPSEALCLGRCHCGLKISPETSLFLLGSGSPSTNGVVAYDLSRDVFFRPHALGSLPQPRFTFACTTLHRGYILVHGGFSSQDSRALGDFYVLDLAPFVTDREFTILPVDDRAGPHRAVADEDARNGRVNARRRRAGEPILISMVNRLGEQAGNARLFMRLLANGSVAAAAELLEDPDSIIGDGIEE